MIKSSRLFFFSFVLISSLILSPVTTVYAISFPAEINKSFTPDAITSGQTSKLRVSIYNPNIFQLTSAHWLDNFPAGITVASPLNITQSCSGTIAAVVGGNSLELTGGIVPPDNGFGTPGSCYVEIDVTSTTPGNLINTIGVGPVNGLSAQGIDGVPPVVVDITNTTPASATLNVVGVQPASVGKAFAPNTIWIGQPSVLTITIRNNDLTTTLTQASLTDTMPANVVLASPAVGATPLTNCGAGVLNATSGNDFVTLSGGSIAPNTTCTITVNVTSSVQGNYLNSIPAGPGGPGSLQTLQSATTAAVNNIPLAVQATTVVKSFSPTAFQTGETSDLTVTLRNPTFANYTGAQFTDNLPANLTLTGLIVSNSCGGTVTAAAGTTALSLSGGTIPPATAAPFAVGSCSVVVRVTSTVPAAPYTNTIPVQTIATGPSIIVSPLPATATVTVTARSIGVVKAFAPASFNPGGTSTLTITLQNRTSTAYTGVSFTDVMPTNLTIVGTPTASAACGGPTLTASDADNVVMTNGTIPAGTVATPGTCVITATVTSSTSAVYSNTILAGDVDATTPLGVTNLADSNIATVTVNAPGGPVTGLKNINPSIIAAGANTRLRIDLTAPADVNLLAFSVTDNFPAGVTISNVNTTGTPTPATKSANCLGGTLSAVTGTNVISWTGGTINAGQLCRIEVYVTSSTPGTVNNTIAPADILNDKGRTVAAPGLEDDLTVTGFSMSKIFNPATVNANGLSTLTITLTNSNSLPLDAVSLSDSLPGTAVNGVRIAPIPNANTTCTGGALPPTVTAVAGAQTISLANGFVPAQALGVPGQCTITVDVRGLGATTTLPAHLNTIFTSNVIGTLQGTGITQRPIAQATSSLVIGSLTMEVVKKFDPQLVYGGSVSTLSVTLRNPNPAAALTGIAFVDTMPVGMILANPVDFNVGTCGGTLSGTPGTNTFSYSGGSLPANTECKLTLKATLTVNGNLTNTIPIGAVTTFNGVSNTTATSASLTNLAGASITKGFAPNPIIAGSGDYSLLTITVQNTTTLDLTQMGLIDDLPAGLEIAAAPAPINNCFGTLDAVAGTQHIQLTNGSLVGNSSCTLLIPVIGATPGVFTNTIPVNTLTTFEGRTNIDPAVATLTLTGFSLGNRVWEDNGAGGGIVNDGLRNGTEPGIDGVTVNLYRDSNNDGTPDGASIATTTTAGGGFYRFDSLPAGTYIVEVVTPAGYTSTVDAGDPDADVDDDDDNGVVISGSNIRSNPVTLGPTANEPITENNPVTNPEAGESIDNQSNRTVDFGFITTYSLGNRVWDDNGAGGGITNDGLRNGTEPGIDGVTVNLYRDSNDDGTPDGAVIATMNTAGGGFYRFDSLSADTYIVEVVPPAGYTSTVDAGDPDADVDDDDDNGVVISGSNIRSNPVTLGPGATEPTIEDNPLANPEAGEAADNRSNRTVDFGFVTAYSLGNRVWNDNGAGAGTANDGLRNGTEPGIDGVTVNLYRDSNDDGTPDGAIIATMNTAGGGFYRFDNLSVDTYIVEVVTPAGYTSTVDAGDPDADVDDDDDNGVVISGSNIRSNPVTLGPIANEPTGEDNPFTNPEAGEAADDQSNRTVDFGFVTAYSLGNRVWDDNGAGGGIANDGLRNGTEPGIDGVTVNLYRDSNDDGTPDGALIATMNTAGGGFYRFDNLYADTYIVEVVPPAGYVSTVDAGDPDADVNDDDDNGVIISGSNIRSNPVTLGPGTSEPTGEDNPLTNPEVGEAVDNQSNRTVDFGFVTAYSLGNRVWEDSGVAGGGANDGLRNGTEPGIDGVTVRLYRDSNNDGTPDGAAIDTTSTSGGGFYRFDNLSADTYIVEVVTPSGYTSSSVDAGDPDADVDDDDDNGVVISGSNIRSNPVTLGPGASEPTGENNPLTNPEAGEAVDNQSNRTVDFGFYFVPYSLGNRVWNDDGAGGGTASDGIRNGTEPGIDGVTVNLYRDSDNNDTPDGAAIATMNTAGGGFYRFDNLIADTYIVEVVPPAGYVSTVDAGDPDADVNDDDDNGVVISGSNIRSNPVTLGPGASEPTLEDNPLTNPEAGEAIDDHSNRTVDFGFVTSYSLGNRVWGDNGAGGGVANDGLRNGTEPGLDGITVRLYRDSNNDGTPDGASIATTTTAGGGFYRFDNLLADTYIVEAVTPIGYTSSSVDAGDPDADVDDDDDNGVVISGSNVRSNPVTLGPGSTEPTGESNPTTNPETGESVDNQSNRTVDFGFFFVPYSLGNRVWMDDGAGGGTASDGVRNGTEPGIDGVTVNLYRDSDNNGTPDGAAIATMNTAGGGFYRFDNLIADTYIVEVVPPTGLASTVDAGDPDTDDDDDDDNGVIISGSNIRSNPVTLGPGASEPTLEDNPLTNPEAGEAIDDHSNRTVDFGFVTGYSLGNRVWEDSGVGGGTANDGIRNGTEPGINSVTVRLYRDSNDDGTPDGAAIATTTTSGGGFYRFDNLAADTYIVEVVTPTGYASTVDAGDPDADVDDDDDNGVVVSGSNIRSNPVTLGPGASEPTLEDNPLPNPGTGEAADDHSNRTVDFGFIKTTTPPPPVSSIQIVKTPSATVVSPGDTVIYSYVVTNTGTTPLTSIIVIDDKCSPVLYVSGDTNTNNTLETTETWNYTCTTTLSVTTTNIATVTGIGSGNQPVQDTDTATVSIAATGMQKNIIGTSETFTSGNNVAIGEMVTYQVTMNLPTGVTLENIVVTDRMDKGLAFVDCVSVNLAGTDITGAVCPPTVSAITDPGDTAKNPANPGRQVQFNIGNVPASAVASTLVIQYRAIVLDVIENQETDTLNNSVTLTWTGGSITAGAPNVTILEPDLAISKSATPTTVTAGTSIQFTLTITHTALSSTDAFDVVVTDVLPDGLEYIACTPITYSGLAPTTQPDPCNIPGGDTLTFLWDSFPLGQSATIVFFARFDGTKSTVFNSASVSWTSLPIDLGPGGYPIVISIHNDTSTERWYDPEDLINIYQIIDGVWINPPLDGGEEDVILPSGLPSTGFAPNVITTLPEQPAEKSYAATDVWLEIPSLGVNIPIVGVPLVEDDWDVSWLWNQAGWLNGTAFPGWQGNSALTGHVTLPNGKSGPFVGLGNLKWGDKILVHAYGTVYTYEVRQNRTVSPNNTSVLKHEDDAWLTLITCKTYIEETNTYARRIAVRAALISITTEKQTNTSKGGR